VRRIAITGGIAEGKSTVLGYLENMGFGVESADRLARETFLMPETQAELAGLLGIDPPVSPETLRARLEDDEIRRRVNECTHPKILAALRSSVARIIEVPLLVETCLLGEFDRVWVVTCGREAQLARLTARVGEVEARRLVRTQLTSRVKIPFADRVFRTNEPESTVQRSVSLAVQRDLR